MKFAIRTANHNDPLTSEDEWRRYPVLAHKYHASSAKNRDPWCACAVIEISSLEEFIQLKEDVKYPIILGDRHEESYYEYPILTIYDDYIE